MAIGNRKLSCFGGNTNKITHLSTNVRKYKIISIRMWYLIKTIANRLTLIAAHLN